MDSTPEEALAEALRERQRVIADREAYTRDPAAHLAQLQAASERITRETSALPQPVNPQLAHYLQRCSFDKALTWLENSP